VRQRWVRLETDRTQEQERKNGKHPERKIELSISQPERLDWALHQIDSHELPSMDAALFHLLTSYSCPLIPWHASASQRTTTRMSNLSSHRGGTDHPALGGACQGWRRLARLPAGSTRGRTGSWTCSRSD
jgi:hypothetical protein